MTHEQFNIEQQSVENGKQKDTVLSEEPERWAGTHGAYNYYESTRAWDCLNENKRPGAEVFSDVWWLYTYAERYVERFTVTLCSEKGCR